MNSNLHHRREYQMKNVSHPDICLLRAEIKEEFFFLQLNESTQVSHAIRETCCNTQMFKRQATLCEELKLRLSRAIIFNSWIVVKFFVIFKHTVSFLSIANFSGHFAHRIE